MGKQASVHWAGSGQAGAGAGEISTESLGLDKAPYGLTTQFGPGELLAAAHASCITMEFSLAAKAAGFDAETVDTQATVRLSKNDTGLFISRIALTLKANVPGMPPELFQTLANTVKASCPLSKALAGVPEITLEAELA